MQRNNHVARRYTDAGPSSVPITTRVTGENVADKLETIENDLKSIRMFVSQREHLIKENEVLKLDIRKLNSDLEDMKISEKHIVASMEALRKDNETLKRDLKAYTDLNRTLEDRLDLERKYRVEISKVEQLRQQLDTVAIYQQMSSNELPEAQAISTSSGDYTGQERVEQLMFEINGLMDNGNVDNAFSTCAALFNANSEDINVVSLFHKVFGIKKNLDTLKEQLLRFDSGVNLIESSFNDFKSITDYPNLLMQMEKKMLDFYWRHKIHLQALHLCQSLISKEDFNDYWVYFVHGELLLQQDDYSGARKAFCNSLRCADKDDDEIDGIFEKAREALQEEVSRNSWTLFNPVGISLTLPELHEEYTTLMKYYHPKEQRTFGRQYRTIARIISKELTKAYRAFSTFRF